MNLLFHFEPKTEISHLVPTEVDKAKEKRVTEQIFDKLKYGLQVHERDGDYVVLWNRPRTVDFSSEHIKWVTPGRDKFEHDLGTSSQVCWSINCSALTNV
jgi:hypothetical protein